MLRPLAEELNASTHQVREALLALVGEGWVTQAKNKGFLAKSPDLATFAEYAELNKWLLVAALHVVNPDASLPTPVRKRISSIHKKLTPFNDDEHALTICIGKLFTAIVELSGNRAATRMVKRCNEDLHFIRTRECQYLDSVDVEIATLCELTLNRDYSELREALTAYHLRRVQPDAPQLRDLSVTSSD